MKLPAFIETGSSLKYVHKFSMPELLILIQKFRALTEPDDWLPYTEQYVVFCIPWASCIHLTPSCPICQRCVSLQYHFIYVSCDFVTNFLFTHFASPVLVLHVPTHVHRISLRHTASWFIILSQILFNRQSGFVEKDAGICTPFE